MTLRPLRVCHLAKYYPPAPGGIETHVQTLARAQAALGAEVRVICVNHRDESGHDVSWRRFSPTPTVDEMDRSVRVTRVGRRFSLAKLDLCRDLRRALVADRPADIVHLHTPNPTMLLAAVRHCRESALVVTHHSDVVRQRLLKHLIRPLEHRVYSRAALILTSSPVYQAGSSLLRRYADRVQSVPLGLDLRPYVNPNSAALVHTKALAQHCEGPRWLSVGRCVYYKGLETAIWALAHVPGTLIVVGTGPMQMELRRLAAKLAVSDRVVWRGYATPDELVGAYHAATALWFPSNARSEGFGLVQVEAMASACPVINTAIANSGVSWVSRHGESGLTIPVNDPAALAAAARRLLDEPGLRVRLASAARRRALAEFDHVAMARRSLELYEQSLAGRRCHDTSADEAEPALAEVEYETV
jgi:rhamnosyl/mannosyltransferase